MAAAAHWDFRSHPDYMDKALMDPLLRIIKARVVKKLHVINYELFQESPDAKAEIRVAYTNEFDGVATPAVVDIISTDANDDAGDNGATAYDLLGIDANDNYVVERIAANGQSAASSTTLWKRLLQLKVATAGSSKKAEGTVTVHENGGIVNTYMTIAANGLSTISARLYIASGKYAMIGFLLGNSIFTSAAGAVDLDAGSNIFPIYADEDLTREIIHKYTIIPGANIRPIPAHWEIRLGTGDNYFTIQHEALNTGKNKDLHLDLFFITWEEHS